MPPAPALVATALPERLRRLAGSAAAAGPRLALGVPEIDAHLAGGLALGRLHEVTAAGLEGELGVLPAGFLAHLLARMPAGHGSILWAAPMDDLYAPGLLGFGLDPGRLLLVRTDDDAQTQQVMETALRQGGLDAVVGEIGALSRIAGRRLHLACLHRGVTGFALRRWPYGRKRDAPRDGTAAATRWRIGAAPSQPPLPRLPGPPRWKLELLHARDGRAGAWIVELTDAPNPLRLVAGISDHPAGQAVGQPMGADRRAAG